MNSRITPAEAALLMPFAMAEDAGAQRIRAVIAEARRARDEALVLRARGFLRFLGGAAAALRRRRETIARLRALSDRELADIGLRRGNIGAAAVAASPMPANDAGRPLRAA